MVVAALCCGLLSTVGCGKGGGTTSPGLALVSSSPPQDGAIPASAVPSLVISFSMVCKEDGVTFLAAQLKTASGVVCVDLGTVGNGVDAQAGKPSMITVTAMAPPQCPLPAEVTSLEVTSVGTVGGWGVFVPFYSDTCFVGQSFPVDYKLVP
jgi:hypothetical protein